MRPKVAAVLGDEVQQDACAPPIGLVELRRVEPPLCALQHGLAGRVNRLVVPVVQRPGRPPLPLGPEEHVIGRSGAKIEPAHPRHLEVRAQGALHVVALVLVVSRRRRRDDGGVVAELDVGPGQPVGPERGIVRLAAHQRAEDVARTAVREIAVLEPPRHVEAQAEVVRDPAVDVAAEAVLVIPGGTVAVVTVLGQPAQGEVIADALTAAP